MLESTSLCKEDELAIASSYFYICPAKLELTRSDELRQIHRQPLSDALGVVLILLSTS
jgi:hypothetical protein